MNNLEILLDKYNEETLFEIKLDKFTDFNTYYSLINMDTLNIPSYQALKNLPRAYNNLVSEVRNEIENKYGLNHKSFDDLAQDLSLFFWENEKIIYMD